MAAKLICTKDAGPFPVIRICDDETDMNQSNLLLSTYKIFDISDSDLVALKTGSKIVASHDGSTVTYEDAAAMVFADEAQLQAYIANFISKIDAFLENNAGHAQYDKWNNYKTQLNNFDTSALSYPFSKTLEKHFSDNSQTFYLPGQVI